jgi:hypothetical protein
MGANQVLPGSRLHGVEGVHSQSVHSGGERRQEAYRPSAPACLGLVRLENGAQGPASDPAFRTGERARRHPLPGSRRET